MPLLFIFAKVGHGYVKLPRWDRRWVLRRTEGDPRYFFRRSGPLAGTVVELPGRTNGSEDEVDTAEAESVVSCTFQDGMLYVYDGWLHIERPGRSKFSGKEIELSDVRGVTYEKRLIISYLQVDEVGVENDEGGLFSAPVDENTLHFGRGMRGCAEQARDAIRDGAGLW